MKAILSPIMTALIAAEPLRPPRRSALGIFVDLGHVGWIAAVPLIYIVARNFGIFLPYLDLAECRGSLGKFMIVSPSPLDIDLARSKRDLSTWRIDDKPVLDLSRAEGRATLTRLLSIPADLHSQWHGSQRRMEDYADIMTRTGGVPVIADDNMDSEWRYNLDLDWQSLPQ
jgi:hypothetical protein